MTDSYKKGVFVMERLKNLGLDRGTIAEAIGDENLEKSYEIIGRNPCITKNEFIELMGIEYDEEEILMHDFLCRLRMQPYHIAEAMDDDNYAITLDIMKTQPDIGREEFLNVMRFTDKYKEELICESEAHNDRA